METERKIGKMEKFQSEVNKIGFIKSYPFLNFLDITFKQRELVELILSYQENGKSFYLNHTDIASILGAEKQSIKNAISILKNKKYITTNVTSNYNGNGGGSSSTIFVDIDLIIYKVKSRLTLEEVVINTTASTQPIVEEIVEPIVEESLNFKTETETEEPEESIEDIILRISNRSNKNQVIDSIDNLVVKPIVIAASKVDEAKETLESILDAAIDKKSEKSEKPSIAELTQYIKLNTKYTNKNLQIFNYIIELVNQGEITTYSELNKTIENLITE